MDIKAPKEKYLKTIGILREGMGGSFFTGKILEYIDKSINILKEGKVDYEFRTTITPATLGEKDILCQPSQLFTRFFNALCLRSTEQTDCP